MEKAKRRKKPSRRLGRELSRRRRKKETNQRGV